MTVRRGSKRRDEPQTPTFTVADYYRQRLAEVPPEPTPVDYADYLRRSGLVD